MQFKSFKTLQVDVFCSPLLPAPQTALPVATRQAEVPNNHVAPHLALNIKVFKTTIYSH
jgi:hypothetical protein